MGDTKRSDLPEFEEGCQLVEHITRARKVVGRVVVGASFDDIADPKGGEERDRRISAAQILAKLPLGDVQRLMQLLDDEFEPIPDRSGKMAARLYRLRKKLKAFCRKNLGIRTVDEAI